MYTIALALLAIVVVNVPLMLLIKPCFFRGGPKVEEANEIEFARIENQEVEEPLVGSINSEEKSNSLLEQTRNIKAIDKVLKDMMVHDHAHTFSEAFIHQMIETIEFVLGTVSNTASYLRLWALSLAHGQLTEVFMNLTFQMSLKADNFALTIVLGILLWPIFWSIVFFILMLMDCLECFLHTLRLHWVEFQNKFFKGEGYAFKPFKYEQILENTLN